MFASFKADGNSDFFTNSLKLVRKTSAKISAFSLRVFVGISVNRKGLSDYFWHTSPIAIMLGWYLYFKIIFIILSATFSNWSYYQRKQVF